MRSVGFIIALLALSISSASAIDAGLVLEPIVAPFCNLAARLWPPVSVPSGPLWLRLIIGSVTTFTPATALYFAFRLEIINNAMMRWSWPMRLGYVWSSAALFVAVADWAATSARAELSLVVFAFSLWALPACLFYGAFVRQERKRREVPAWVENPDDPGWRDHFIFAVREALIGILGFIFERGRTEHEDPHVFGKSASLNARDNAL